MWTYKEQENNLLQHPIHTRLNFLPSPAHPHPTPFPYHFSCSMVNILSVWMVVHWFSCNICFVQHCHARILTIENELTKLSRTSYRIWIATLHQQIFYITLNYLYRKNILLKIGMQRIGRWIAKCLKFTTKQVIHHKTVYQRSIITIKIWNSEKINALIFLDFYVC